MASWRAGWKENREQNFKIYVNEPCLRFCFFFLFLVCSLEYISYLPFSSDRHNNTCPFVIILLFRFFFFFLCCWSKSYSSCLHWYAGKYRLPHDAYMCKHVWEVWTRSFGGKKEDWFFFGYSPFSLFAFHCSFQLGVGQIYARSLGSWEEKVEYEIKKL